MAEAGLIESYRGFVNSWECDENDHLNVQGYAHRFEIAARHAYAGIGAKWDAGDLRTRHIRYHKECGEGDLIRVETAACAGEPNRLFHVYRDADTGALLATAIDTVSGEIPAELPRADTPEEALARSMSPDCDLETRGDAALHTAGYGLTYTGIVAPQHCGPEGTLDDQHFISRGSDGVAHLWSRAGFTKAVLDEIGCGRVAVEMKLSIAQRPAMGTLLHLTSGMVEVSRSTLQFRHVFMNSETGQSFATLSVTALVMDLSTRRAIRFTENMRKLADEALVTG